MLGSVDRRGVWIVFWKDLGISVLIFLTLLVLVLVLLISSGFLLWLADHASLWQGVIVAGLPGMVVFGWVRVIGSIFSQLRQDLLALADGFDQ